MYCSGFSQLLAESECKGCVWDILDLKKKIPDIAAQYWAASKESELFHEPTENCSVSKYVRRFAPFYGVSNYAVP